MSSLTFLGAARTVTGSKHLVNTGSHQVLVDCGLFQGHKDLRLRNWADLTLPAKDIDAVVLTHAHLDHVGYLPRLVAQGFRGRVFCTPGTLDLARLVLVDSANLQEEDARQANREGYSRHHPALPLYTVADAWRAISQLQPLGYDRPVTVAPGVQISFVPMGHLLGAAAVRMTLEGGPAIVFGGDLGRYDRPVLRDPHPIASADVLLLESTYGDRMHEPDDGGARLAEIITDTTKRGGRLIIPSFAIGRVEEILYWIRRLEEQHRIPVLPVYLDSPMATEALQSYKNRTAELDPDLVMNGGLHLRVVGAAVPGARAVRQAGHHRVVERHGDRRTRAALPAHDAAQPEEHDSLRGVPGRRHPGPVAGRRGLAGEDARAARRRARPHREAGLDVGACRRERDPPLAARLHNAAAHHVSGARRADRPGGPRRAHQHRAGMEDAHPGSRRDRRPLIGALR
jgi:Cft2 family RNA processing exonuclease